MPLKEHLYQEKNKAIMQTGGEGGWGEEKRRAFITGRNNNKPFIEG